MAKKSVNGQASSGQPTQLKQELLRIFAEELTTFVKAEVGTRYDLSGLKAKVQGLLPAISPAELDAVIQEVLAQHATSSFRAAVQTALA